MLPGLQRLGLVASAAVLGISSAPAEHRVLPKATFDHLAFTVRSIVLTDGALLAFYSRPAAEKQPTLVLVPETHGDRTQFFERAFMEKLPKGLGLVVIESRGQGRSWPPPSAGQATIEQYASDVLEVVAAVKPAQWFIGGHSLGGMIALEVAGRRPPELIGVIALEGWAHSRVSREAFPERAPRTEAQREDAQQQREERYRTQRWTAEEKTALGRAWTSWQRGESILRDIAYPVLSVWGDRGMAVRPGREKLLLPENPAIVLTWIAGSDHYVTDPPYAGEVASAITRFVTRVAAAPTHQIVYRERGRFGGWPANHGIWCWGDEVVVGFTAAWHQAQDVTRHQMAREKPREQFLARTLDGGRTWAIERPATLVPIESAKVTPKPLAGPIDFSRPGFALTMRFNDKDDGASYFFFSYDQGRQWSGPHEFPRMGTPAILARTDYIVHGPRELTLFLTAAKANRREGRPLCARTTDGGQTWKLVSFIGPEPDGFVIMPSTVAEGESGFLTTVRVKEATGNWIDAWRSRDRGETWQRRGRPVADTGGSSGNPPHLLRLRDGRLCLTYGYRSEPRGIRARLSGDDGATWGDEITLRDDAVTHDLGYPRSFQRSDGKVVTVYYYNEGLQTERFIAATTWDPGSPPAP